MNRQGVNLRRKRLDRNRPAVFGAFNKETHRAINFGVQSVIFAHANVIAWVEFSATLTDDNAAG